LSEENYVTPRLCLTPPSVNFNFLYSCDGTIAPTAAPAFTSMTEVAGGCPADYDENNLSGIDEGDQVSLLVSATTGDERRVVYECKAGAVAAYCKQKVFIPGGMYSAMAWTLKGYCDGTMSPTQAPTAYNNADLPTVNIPVSCEVQTAANSNVKLCYYEKTVTTTSVSCMCGDSDCPNPTGLAGASTACKKTTVETSCLSVDTYSSSTSYDAGDVMRIGNARFKCREWPYNKWCRNSAYKPSLEAGIWSKAWSTDGTCSALTQAVLTGSLSIDNVSGRRRLVSNLPEGFINAVQDSICAHTGYEDCSTTVTKINGQSLGSIRGRQLQSSTILIEFETIIQIIQTNPQPIQTLADSVYQQASSVLQSAITSDTLIDSISDASSAIANLLTSADISGDFSEVVMPGMPTPSLSRNPTISPTTTSSPSKWRYAFSNDSGVDIQTAIDEYLNQDCKTDLDCQARKDYGGAVSRERCSFFHSRLTHFLL